MVLDGVGITLLRVGTGIVDIAREADAGSGQDTCDRTEGSLSRTHGVVWEVSEDAM